MSVDAQRLMDLCTYFHIGKYRHFCACTCDLLLSLSMERSTPDYHCPDVAVADNGTKHLGWYWCSYFGDSIEYVPCEENACIPEDSDGQQRCKSETNG